jgi:hypothetical protein
MATTIDSSTTGEVAIMPDRAAAFEQVRAELRDNHPRLTDKQIDLIAEVAVDLRLTRMRLGLPADAAPPTPIPATPQRMRVPALA